MTSIDPLGDRGFLARFASEAEASGWAEAVRELRLPGVIDVVTAYDTVGIHADPERVDLDGLERQLSAIVAGAVALGSYRQIPIPTLYDGPDLDESARALDLPVEELVRAHSSREYQVFALGFLPGFPYAGYLPDCLTGLPRRPTPRVRVPAGSVAIVGRQTAIYPEVSPGGWHLIGRTPLRIVDVEAEEFPIRAGDRLRFVPIDRTEYEARLGENLRT